MDEERYRRLAQELDAVKQAAMAAVGDSDVAHLKRLDLISKSLEAAGRVLIFLSLEPFAFLSGVFLLFLHKQLQSLEIGHAALHGAYDRLKGAEAFAAARFTWDLPVDEASWRHGHNLRHHGHANVAGHDGDMRFGPVRLSAAMPHAAYNRHQLLFTLAVLLPNFALAMNAHFSGLLDFMWGHDRQEDQGAAPSLPSAAWKALRKSIPYYFKNYVFFPALAGSGFWKVLLGNWLAERLRDLWTGASILCNHVGEDVRHFPKGTRARSRGEWYAMQIEGSNNFEVSAPLSMLCGGLDRQIEHHLFPKLPPRRLREVAPQVRAICARYGVTYRTDSWARTLLKSLRNIGRLAHADAAAARTSIAADDFEHAVD